MSEFLRIKQGNGQIAEQQNRKDECNCRNQIHGLPQLLACLHVEKGNAKENHREEEHRYILHRKSRSICRVRALAPHSKPRTSVLTSVLKTVWLLKRLIARRNV
jgi:hypothetical protein